MFGKRRNREKEPLKNAPPAPAPAPSKATWGRKSSSGATSQSRPQLSSPTSPYKSSSSARSTPSVASPTSPPTVPPGHLTPSQRFAGRSFLLDFSPLAEIKGAQGSTSTPDLHQGINAPLPPPPMPHSSTSPVPVVGGTKATVNVNAYASRTVKIPGQNQSQNQSSSRSHQAGPGAGVGVGVGQRKSSLGGAQAPTTPKRPPVSGTNANTVGYVGRRSGSESEDSQRSLTNSASHSTAATSSNAHTNIHTHTHGPTTNPHLLSPIQTDLTPRSPPFYPQRSGGSSPARTFSPTGLGATVASQGLARAIESGPPSPVDIGSPVERAPVPPLAPFAQSHVVHGHGHGHGQKGLGIVSPPMTPPKGKSNSRRPSEPATAPQMQMQGLRSQAPQRMQSLFESALVETDAAANPSPAHHSRSASGTRPAPNAASVPSSRSAKAVVRNASPGSEESDSAPTPDLTFSPGSALSEAESPVDGMNSRESFGFPRIVTTAGSADDHVETMAGSTEGEDGGKLVSPRVEGGSRYSMIFGEGAWRAKLEREASVKGNGNGNGSGSGKGQEQQKQKPVATAQVQKPQPVSQPEPVSPPPQQRTRAPPPPPIQTGSTTPPTAATTPHPKPQSSFNSSLPLAPVVPQRSTARSASESTPPAAFAPPSASALRAAAAATPASRRSPQPQTQPERPVSSNSQVSSPPSSSSASLATPKTVTPKGSRGELRVDASRSSRSDRSSESRSQQQQNGRQQQQRRQTSSSSHPRGPLPPTPNSPPASPPPRSPQPERERERNVLRRASHQQMLQQQQQRPNSAYDDRSRMSPPSSSAAAQRASYMESGAAAAQQQRQQSAPRRDSLMQSQGQAAPPRRDSLVHSQAQVNGQRDRTSVHTPDAVKEISPEQNRRVSRGPLPTPPTAWKAQPEKGRRQSTDRSASFHSTTSSVDTSSEEPAKSDAEEEETEESAEVDEDDDEEEKLMATEGPAPFEIALAHFPNTVLFTLLSYLDYNDFRPLPEVSRLLRRSLNVGEAKEVILDRYLGEHGYRTIPLPRGQVLGMALGGGGFPPPSPRGGTFHGRKSSTDYNVSIIRNTRVAGSDHGHGANPQRMSTMGSVQKEQVVNYSLRDLDAFMVGQKFSSKDYALCAKAHKSRPLDTITFNMIRASMAAYNNLVLRIRSQPAALTEGPGRSYGDGKRGLAMTKPQFRPKQTDAIPSPIRGITKYLFKPGRALVLRVWVPCAGSWMADEELIECERELWRSGSWGHLRRADVIWNIAVGDFANEGKLLFDSKYLRDLAYTFDHIGHLPSWLNMLAFSPSYFHNIIVASSPDPVLYLDLTLFHEQVVKTMRLYQDKVEVTSPQGRYRVQKYVYRSQIQVASGTLIGSNGGVGGRGPGGIEVVNDDWTGQLVIETEGTTEHAQTLVDICTPKQQTPAHRFARFDAKPQEKEVILAPWRIIRDRSRPGKIWIRPVFPAEQVA